MSTIEFQVSCHACGTGLAGVDTGGLCPSCGHRVVETVDDRIIDPRSGQVAADLTCATCAYNLRTLAFAAVCPECGTPVLNSLRVDELRFCDPAWLGRIRRGLTIVVASVLVTILLGMLLGIFFIASGVGPGGTPTMPGLLVVVIPSVVMYALVVWGTFCITSPKPDAPADDRTNRIGKLSRISLIAALALGLVGTLVNDPTAFMGGAKFVFGFWEMLPGLISTVLYVGASIGTTFVLCRIAVLGRRPGLHRLTRILCWLAGAQGIVSTASLIVTAAAMPAINAAALGPGGFTATTTVGSGGASVTTTSSAIPGSTQPTSSAPAASATTPAAAPPVASPFPTRSMGALMVVGCASALLSLSLFILGLIAISKYRTLLTSAIAASVWVRPVS